MVVEVLKIYSDTAPSDLRGSAAVVIDVLRATTSICRLLARGARAVVPAASHDEARRIRDEIVAGGGAVILAGESGGLRARGFDMGNSPVEMDRADVAGASVVLSTTNGTKALSHCREADGVLAGSFNNGSAIVEALSGADRVVLVCSGGDGGYSPEDHWCAGFIAEALLDGGATAGAGAEEAVTAWKEAMGDLAGSLGGTPHGGHLVGLGFGDDLACAALIDSHRIVAEMRDGELVGHSPQGPQDRRAGRARGGQSPQIKP